jgi:hypothetical protein
VTPALQIPIKVVGLDTFKTSMTEMNVTATNVARTVTATTIKMSAGFLASQGAAGAATIAFGQLLGTLRPILLGVTAVVDTFELLKESIKLAGEQIAAFNQIAAQAGSANVSTDFYQRFTKSAPNAVIQIDQVTQALQNFNKAASDKLGGSDLQQRIDELTKAGNLSGNTGTGAFASADTTEAKLRAIVALIDQAEQKGERLAALDIASKAFGEPVANALRQDSGYLDQVLQKADAMSKTKLVSDDDIGRAIDLKTRLDAAQATLADKWKPIQSDLAQLGINAHDNWISVIQVFADLVGLADKLYETIKEIPGIATQIGSSSIWTRFTELTGKLGLNSDPASLGIETGIDVQKLAATNKLRAGLMNPANVQRAMQETSETSFGARKDTSKAPAKTATDGDDKVDAAINSLRRHTEQSEADAKAVGLGAGALAQFRAEAQETSAVQANGGKETADQAAAFKKLEQQAGAAADALAKAKVNSQISFGKQTAFLTPEDVQIANQLKGIYGDDVPKALNSTEAAALRMNDTLKGVSTSFQNDITDPLTDFVTGAKSAQDAFSTFATSFVRDLVKMALQAAVIKPLMSGIGGLFGLSRASTALPLPGSGSFIGPVAKADGGLISGPGTGRSDSIPARLSNGEFVVNADATAKHRAVLEAINSDRVPHFADGGLVGNGGGLPAPLIGHTSVIAPSIAVTVQGNPGASNADHQRLGATLAAQIVPSIRGMVGDELRNQMRPGGTLHSAYKR